jgi:hypothetical protein
MSSGRAEGIAKKIQVNEVEVFIHRLENVSKNEMKTCAKDLVELCPEKVIMLLTVLSNEIFIVAIMPEWARARLDSKWVQDCVSNIKAGSTKSTIERSDDFITTALVEFPGLFPLGRDKEIEAAMGHAFAFLKKCKVYQEIDEKEYDFDDI